MYRRTRTSSDIVSQPPYFLYTVRCDWTGNQLPRDPALSPRRADSPMSSPRSPQASPRNVCSRDSSMPSKPALPVGFEPPWPWWDPLPGTYTVKRKWHEIVKFHEALANELAIDQKLGCRRVKTRTPALPDRGDLQSWLKGYASIGDAKVLGRATPCNLPKERERSLEDLRDLHWIYVMNRLTPYFADVNAILHELPTEILAGSTALRRFVTGGVTGRRQPSSKPVQPRFFGPPPSVPDREEIAAAVRMMRRSGSAPLLARDGKALHAGPPAAAARLMLAPGKGK